MTSIYTVLLSYIIKFSLRMAYLLYFTRKIIVTIIGGVKMYLNSRGFI